MLICVLIVPFTAFTALFFLPLLGLIVSLIYRTVTIAGRSATPGMRLVAMEFRTHDGRRFDLAMAALHTLGYTVSVSMVFPQVISIILMLTSAPRPGTDRHGAGHGGAEPGRGSLITSLFQGGLAERKSVANLK